MSTGTTTPEAQAGRAPLLGTARTYLARRQTRAAVLPLVALAGMVIYFGVRQSSFLGASNLTVMATQAGPLLMISLGATFVVLMGSIDLSVGAVAALTAAVSGQLLNSSGLGDWVLAIGVGIGAAAGLMNAIIVSYLRLPSFIVTLGTMSIFEGITEHRLGGESIQLLNPRFQDLANSQLISRVPNVFLIAALMWIAFIFLNENTRFGRYVVAIGANEPVTRLSGISVRRFKVLAFILSGACAGVGGVFILSQLGSATPDLGDTYLLSTIAAIVVGGTALSGGVGGIPRTMLGVVLITVLGDGLNVTGVSPFTQNIVTGAVVIAAVLVTIDRDQLNNIIK